MSTRNASDSHQSTSSKPWEYLVVGKKKIQTTSSTSVYTIRYAQYFVSKVVNVVIPQSKIEAAIHYVSILKEKQLILNRSCK